MQTVLVEVLAAVAAAIATASLVSTWRRLTRTAKSESITVTRQDTKKSVVLPKEYSPSAVKALAELVA
jgi:hypothetical protein